MSLLDVLRELGQIKYTIIESEKENSDVQDSQSFHQSRKGSRESYRRG